ncbi:hypothetical protein [Modestobacter sp. VKM Ac-2984]|uniref:hypothetical protein n=1 Tax=Modestobacter sp. VKM Ac-2984 TaxID=3004138 RepID=UPI0022AB06AC|nr:hypothetical protein [Modestobacter sp. VKM Ac-2984]MCZ2817256.1 hypothetical protein [Modestobacter sp. VKM Ac-2984]
MFGGRRLAPCPYCYEGVDTSTPAFRCTGRPAPGRKACEKQRDDVRDEVLADATPTFPVFRPQKGRRIGSLVEAECPHCFSRTGIRLCPTCHSPLPANFTGNSPLFGLIGVRGSGKTVLLSVLSKELTSSVARRFGAAIDTVGNSALLTRLDGYRRALEPGGDGTLPEQTPEFTKTDTVPAVFEWQMTTQRRGLGGGSASTIISFYDTSGEDLATLDRARNQHYLAATDGLILLLDPFGLPANRDTALARGIDPQNLRDTPIQVLTAVTGMLQEADRLGPNKKIKRPLAVVLAKIDAFFADVGADDPIRRVPAALPVFDEQESLDLHHHVESLVDRWGGDDVLRHLRHNYTSYRFFVASALGAEPEYASARANNRGLRPHRVAEPLLWLMADRGFLPKEK